MRSMRQFYPDYESIHQFTLSLDYHQRELVCLHCSKSDQFVSHGIIYKQHSICDLEKIGKRIFCSNRYGRKGCGRTFGLYVANKIPRLRYGAAQLFVFITSLLANLSVAKAYQKATNQLESRNAWRWLNKLMHRLSHYRALLKKRDGTFLPPYHTSSKRLPHLLPTLKRLFSQTTHCPCWSFQLSQQIRFM